MIAFFSDARGRAADVSSTLGMRSPFQDRLSSKSLPRIFASLVSVDVGGQSFARKSRLRDFASTSYSICACKRTTLSTLFRQALGQLNNRMLIPSVDYVRFWVKSRHVRRNSRCLL